MGTGTRRAPLDEDGCGEASFSVKIMLSGLIANIQRYCLQDGPGIRTTVFMKGCPLDCWWCHNPESRSEEPEVVVVESRCIRCGECVPACPEEIAGPAGEDFDRDSCRRCGACVESCPTGARQMTGSRMTVEEVMTEILKDRIFHEDSSGGVTFSGGEPLMQPEFLAALLKACRRVGVRTALDTCGFAPRKDLLGSAMLSDLVLYDVKAVDDALHRELTGVSNQSILENLEALSREHPNLWLRVPVIPGVNDSPEEFEAMARLAASLPGVRQVNLLPYHRTGIQKFRRLGREYRLPEVTPPSDEAIAAAVEYFRARGVKAVAGG